MTDKTAFSVPRYDAAELLGVSLRTLDRYTKKKTISSKRRGRALFFSEEELLQFKAEHFVKEELRQQKKEKESAKSKGQSTASRQQRTDDFADVRSAQEKEQEVLRDVEVIDPEFAVIRDELLRRSPEESIFKTLYKKAEGELEKLRNQLQTANYRVGQLEAQVKTMVPLLQYKQEKQKYLVLSEQYQATQETIQDLERQVQIERFAKKVYGVFLWFMTALIPILLVVRFIYG